MEISTDAEVVSSKGTRLSTAKHWLVQCLYRRQLDTMLVPTSTSQLKPVHSSTRLCPAWSPPYLLLLRLLVVGMVVLCCRGVYAGSKAAVMRMSDALRLELHPLGISVMVVAPGFIKTNARGTAKVSVGWSHTVSLAVCGCVPVAAARHVGGQMPAGMLCIPTQQCWCVGGEVLDDCTIINEGTLFVLSHQQALSKLRFFNLMHPVVPCCLACSVITQEIAGGYSTSTGGSRPTLWTGW